MLLLGTMVERIYLIYGILENAKTCLYSNKADDVFETNPITVIFVLPHCYKLFLKILQNPQENTCTRGPFLVKLQVWACNLFKKRLWHKYFSVNFAKFSRTPFLLNTSGRLLLNSLFRRFSKVMVKIRKKYQRKFILFRYLVILKFDNYFKTLAVYYYNCLLVCTMYSLGGVYMRKIIPLKWDISPEWDLGRMVYFTL